MAIVKPNRSNDYQFTIESKSDPMLIDLKRKIKKHNRDRDGGDRLRIKLNPRGNYIKSKHWTGATVYNSNHSVATHFDVYVYEVYGTARGLV